MNKYALTLGSHNHIKHLIMSVVTNHLESLNI